MNEQIAARNGSEEVCMKQRSHEPDATMNEAAWNRLLNLIRDGTVVPVVGPQLLVGSAGRQSLQRDIAERLLSQYEVEIDLNKLPPFRKLDAAVSRGASRCFLEGVSGWSLGGRNGGTSTRPTKPL